MQRAIASDFRRAVHCCSCPQSLFKIHPDNDALFARVLRELPAARLVCFNGRDPQLSAQYQGRLEAAGIAADRVCMLPQCAHDDFLRINALCDVMVDTLHWSGGNTSLDALACALPIVTLPGRFMRGRQSAGMLRLMGIDELVARDTDDYVRIAARLVDDVAWRSALTARIREGRARVFDDPAPSTALAGVSAHLPSGGNLTLRDENAQRGFDFAQRSRPIARRLLAEQPCRRIPGTIGAAKHPSPVGDEREQHPHGLPEGAGQMRKTGVHADHEIEFAHQRSEAIEVVAHRQCHEPFGVRGVHRSEHVGLPLQREPPYAGYVEQWRERRERQAASDVVGVAGGAGPCDADFQR